ncbi:MAG: nucleotidyltransferase domain-containing protein, partial [Myxococcota bacterium]
DLLEDLGTRQWDYRRLTRNVIYSAVVGSQAWGLAHENSDEDVRGCFVAPFEDVTGLWTMPGEIHDPYGDAAYWEVENLIEQGLRGDANTLETLWSPLKRVSTPLGDELLRRRSMFVSMNILGSFGRYAQSQFKKIERSLERDSAVHAILNGIEAGRIHNDTAASQIFLELGLANTAKDGRKELTAVCRSLFDRGVVPSAAFESVLDAVRSGRRSELAPAPYRPKNAYNLLRLLHSCVRWLQHGEPMIQVEGAIRDRLLAIKTQQVPIEDVLAEARSVAAAVDEAATKSKLPEKPDFAAADEFLRLCRKESTRVSVAPNLPAPDDTEFLSARWVPRLTPSPLPPDIDVDSVHDFLEIQSSNIRPGRIIWIGLTGSHSYGFPSPDSDLDLKGIFVLPARALLGVGSPQMTHDYLAQWREREFDMTLHEVGKAAELLLQGNGNMLERLLGPLPVWSTDLGAHLAELARGSLSKRSANHYSGFFKGMQRECLVKLRENALTAKALLYGYRVALTGVHLLSTGELETNINSLGSRYGFGRVEELVETKRLGEFHPVSPEMYEKTRVDFEVLETRLQEARDQSPLPDAPLNSAAVNDFVIECRLHCSDAMS